MAVKLDESGNLLWNSFLGGAGNDSGQSIAVDGSGNVLLGGYSTASWGSPVRPYSSGDDVIAMKLDASGNLLWSSFLGGAGNDSGQSIAVDGSGNVLLGGASGSPWGSPVRFYSGSNDAIAVKLDSSGNLLWNTFLGGAGIDYGYSIAVDDSGNLLLGGRSNATWGSPVRGYSGNSDAIAVKLDSSGNLLWNSFLGGTGTDYGYSIVADESGNLLLGGYSNATWGSPVRSYSSVNDATAMKLDSSGNLLWNTFLGGTGSDYGYSIVTDGSANVLLGAYSNATWGSPLRAYSSGYDAMAVKLDSSGNLLWNTFLGGPGADYGYAIALDSAHTYLAGYSTENWGIPLTSCAPPQDAFAIKIALDNPTAIPTLTETPLAGLTTTPTPTITPIPSNTVSLPGSPNLQIRVLNPLVKTGTLLIECRLPEARHLTLALYTLSGQRSLAASSTQPGGVSFWQHNVTSLGQGSYLLLIEGPGVFHKQRIVVVR
jgi:hypothetical protein